MRTTIILTAFSLITVSAESQTKPGFSSQNYVGITEGESGTALQLQTINGFKYKTWFAGIGTGLDYYYQRTVPLFFSVSKFLDSKKFPVYMSADAGINFPWQRDDMYYFEYPGEYHAGLYWGSGLGYRFAFKNKNALLLNLGYNYKRITQSYQYTAPCLAPPCQVFNEKYDYRLKRLSVRVGWSF
jgi:hypothetical protein